MKLVIGFASGRVPTQKQSGYVDGVGKSKEPTMLLPIVLLGILMALLVVVWG